MSGFVNFFVSKNLKIIFAIAKKQLSRFYSKIRTFLIFGFGDCDQNGDFFGNIH